MIDLTALGITLLAVAAWCWATSPTIRQRRHTTRRQRADRRYARTHRIQQ